MPVALDCEVGSWSGSSVSESAATPPVRSRLCVVDLCPHRSSDGADLRSHVFSSHRDRALVLEELGQAVRVPYEGFWEADTKRFLLSCPLGVYVVTLTLQWEQPRSLMVSVDAHDDAAVWNVWEVICHEGSDADDHHVASAHLRARGVHYHEVDTVFYPLQADKGFWPAVFLRPLLQ